jgi:hypothetical protein
MPMERPRQQPDEQQDPTRRPTPVLARTSSGVKVIPPPPRATANGNGGHASPALRMEPAAVVHARYGIRPGAVSPAVGRKGREPLEKPA